MQTVPLRTLVQLVWIAFSFCPQTHITYLLVYPVNSQMGNKHKIREIQMVTDTSKLLQKRIMDASHYQTKRYGPQAFWRCINLKLLHLINYFKAVCKFTFFVSLFSYLIRSFVFSLPFFFPLLFIVRY